MLISTPEEVEAFIAAIPQGQVVRIEDMRQELAYRHGAFITCPMTAAIFANIVARAYTEREESTGEPSIPWWRLLASKGRLNPKYPGGAAEQARRLREEGVEV
jgi:alkylated DNA nucleotide flippase Atl1